MNSSGRTLALVQSFVRYFGQTAARNSSATTEVASKKFPLLKQGQKQFGIEDDTLVHVKGGFGDKLVYGITTALITIGMGMTGEVLYKLSFK